MSVVITSLLYLCRVLPRRGTSRDPQVERLSPETLLRRFLNGTTAAHWAGDIKSHRPFFVAGHSNV
jgi:hypothetical protein